MLTPSNDIRPVAAPAVATEVLSFSLGGIRFALAQASAVNVMTLEGERWERMLKLAKTGTLGASGLPLIRLAKRLGCEPATPAARGTLVLFGRDGRTRATLLIDAIPEKVDAEIATLPSAWRERFSPCEDLISGIARLPDGAQAALLDVSIGVARARPVVTASSDRDSAHLLVRAGRPELEAVRVAALRGMSPLDESGRTLLLLGGDEEPVVVDAVVGLAPMGRIERSGSARMLVAGERRYRLIEPGAGIPSTREAARVLLTAPSGEGRTRMRDLVRSLGHDVSLADDPRAAMLAGGRFDVILFDLDAYGACVPPGGATRCIGFRAQGGAGVPDGFSAVIPSGDGLALVSALLGPRAQAA